MHINRYMDPYRIEYGYRETEVESPHSYLQLEQTEPIWMHVGRSKPDVDSYTW